MLLLTSKNFGFFNFTKIKNFAPENGGGMAPSPLATASVCDPD